jgi:hypothetical protein
VSAGLLAMSMHERAREVAGEPRMNTPGTSAVNDTSVVALAPPPATDASSGSIALPPANPQPEEGRFSRLSPIPPGAKGPIGGSENTPESPRPVSDGPPREPRSVEPREEKAPPPPPSVASRAEERATSAAEGASSALQEFASSVAGREAASVERVLRGPDGTRAQFLALLREGRLSFAVPAGVSPDVQGGRATMSFTTTVSLRTSFGANRRRSVPFQAEFARSGLGWRLVVLQILESVELK